MQLILVLLSGFAMGCTGEDPPPEQACDCGGLEGEFCDFDVRYEYMCDETCDELCFCQARLGTHEWIRTSKPCVCLTDTGMENVPECDPPTE